MTSAHRSPLSGVSEAPAPAAASHHQESTRPPAPPQAPIVPHVHTIHGEVRVDDYFWLRDRQNPEVLAYLEAENRYTEASMAHTASLQETLYQELRGRIKETDLSVPEPLDDYLYYTRTEAGRQYPIICRRRRGAGADAGAMAENDAKAGPEEVLLDENILAEGHSYFRVGAVEVSPDHRLLAYSVDTSGSEAFTLYIKDLATGALLPETILTTSPSVAWANDNSLFYLVLDEARRPHRLYRHLLGTNPVDDALVFAEEDGAFFVDVARTRSRAYLLVGVSSHSTSETWFVSADRPAEPLRLIEPRRHGIEYSVTHHRGRFFITTNDGAPNFRLVEAPVATPSREHWVDVLPPSPDVKIDGTDPFHDHLVVYEREAGLRQLRVIDLRSGTNHRIEFPEPVYTIRQHENPEFNTTVVRFTYTSLVTPNAVVDYDMAARTWTARKQMEVLGGFDPANYRSERLFATAADGTPIPISIVYRVPFTRDGRRPLVLHGYGAYGVSYDPAFSSPAVSLLDRGFAVAIAHIRGGEELGRAWYDAGRLSKKRNSFTDFIAAAEHLVAEGYTSRDRLVASGGSAGGLLVGAVANLRPDLFHAIVAEVPFVDVVNTMLDATLPLTVIEYDEWGNPEDVEAYAYIRSYSPYDNVEAKAYPHLLITGGLNDTRVAYWEPAKWAAKLRALKTDRNRLLLKTNMGAGHGGASGRYDALREVAFKYAFMLEVLGMATNRLAFASVQGKP